MSVSFSMDFPALHGTTDLAIKKARTADVVLTIRQGAEPVSCREIGIQQLRHDFGFGCNGFKAIALANGKLSGEEEALSKAYAERLLKLFDFITLPFYWGQYEPVRGKTEEASLVTAARWFRERGCRLKGHPLCWHTLCAPWLMDLDDEMAFRTQLERIKRDVLAFKGLIDSWDVINEAVIMPIFDKYDNAVTRICRRVGRIPLIRACFESARGANPNAQLIINDFDYTSPYEILIEGCLEAGIRIDAIGIQSHMHQGYWGAEKTLAILERYERFGLPIHFSETTIISGKLMPAHIVDLNDYQVDSWPSEAEAEERQAREVVLHYKTLLSRPLVKSLTWWDLIDGQWLKAPSGLIRADASPKPAYNELVNLIKGEWWAKPATLRCDEKGRLRFNAFLGTYRLTLGGKTSELTVDKNGQREFYIDF